MSNTEKVTETTSKFTRNVFDSLSQACTEAGIPLQHVCREAGVDRSVVEKWKKGDPKSVRTIDALTEALEKLKQAKTQTHE